VSITTTTRLGLTRWSAESDSPIRTQFDTANGQLDLLVAGYTHDHLSNRPAPGKRGWFFFDDDAGVLYYDTGPAWITLTYAAGADADITNSAPGDVRHAGATGKRADAGHTHGREGFGAVVAVTKFGLPAGNGTSGSLAHADHSHGSPAVHAAGVLMGARSALNFVGMAVTDDAAGDQTTVTGVALAGGTTTAAAGDVAADGTSAGSAHADHRHGMPAADPAVGTAGFRTLGAGGLQAAPGDHTHPIITLHRQSFTASTTFVVPANVTELIVTLIGAGGGGGYGVPGPGNEPGAAGSSGVTVSRQSLPVTPGASLPVIIGAGGVGAVNGAGQRWLTTGGTTGSGGTNTNATDGGSTSFGGLTAPGGKAGANTVASMTAGNFPAAGTPYSVSPEHLSAVYNTATGISSVPCTGGRGGGGLVGGNGNGAGHDQNTGPWGSAQTPLFLPPGLASGGGGAGGTAPGSTGVSSASGGNSGGMGTGGNGGNGGGAANGHLPPSAQAGVGNGGQGSGVWNVDAAIHGGAGGDGPAGTGAGGGGGGGVSAGSSSPTPSIQTDVFGGSGGHGGSGTVLLEWVA
jgi:hypothetical protein